MSILGVFCRTIGRSNCRLISSQWMKRRLSSVSLLRGESREKWLKMVREKASSNLVRDWERLNTDLEELKQLQQTSDNELKEMVNQDLDELCRKLDDLETHLIEDLVTDDQVHSNKAILEINCGVGGQEAMLFADEMLQVYERYLTNKGWSFHFLSKHPSDLGGLREVSLHVEGQHCYRFLRHEAGVHRVQRVPKTEKSGRIHTSTITVAVLPLDEKGIEITLDPKDLKIDTKRSQGAGGQHVNKTESCVCITHLPTGIVSECQEERNQVQNKEIALNKLKQLLFLREKEKRFNLQTQERKAQVGTGSRSEKVRTYNFVQDRVTDHRLDENMYDIKELMRGSPEKLSQLIDRLEMKHKSSLVNQLIKSFQ